MKKQDLIEHLQHIFSDIDAKIVDDKRIDINAKKEQVSAILKLLRDEGYDHLALISCTDWIEQDEFKLIYILTNYTDDNKIYLEKGNIHLNIRISRKQPEIESVINVFVNAEPYEREIHELFGVKFHNHPRLIHLLLERDYDIPPFRKDFDTRKYVKDVFDKIPFVRNE
jgi:NADH-quinone oxidoreductase subunit C